jgi:outer membrane protein
MQELVSIMAFSPRAALLVLALAVLMPVAALAQQDEDAIPGEAYHFQAQVRAVYVNPTNSHLPLNFDLGGTVMGELAGEWLFMPRWSTELSLATPASLNVQVGPGSVRVTTQTWTVKYYFPGTGGLSPYIGTGIYHASASAEDTGPTIGVGNPGVGWVLQGGFTFGITPNLFVSGDLRYLDGFEPTLIVDGSPSGHVGVDPIFIGVGVGFRF